MEMSRDTNIVKVALKELVRLNQLQQVLHGAVPRARLKISDAVFPLKLLVVGNHVQTLIVISILVQVSVEYSAWDFGRRVVH